MIKINEDLTCETPTNQNKTKEKTVTTFKLRH
jgi:hypothetical protein